MNIAPALSKKVMNSERPRASSDGGAFSWPREFFGNRFVYTVISPRARGLSIGINMNPDRLCNFDCVYCEVERSSPPTETSLDVEVMAMELRSTLDRVYSGAIRSSPRYANLPGELLQLRHVALSGEGEPTLCPNFAEAMQEIVHVRAEAGHPFFKIILITNATGLDAELVRRSLKMLTSQDEVWAKMDVGSQGYMDRVNRPNQVALAKVMGNILLLGRERPVVIQSLFPLIAGQEPDEAEITQFVNRLQELKAAGALIPLVQIYSATRPMANTACGHLPLKRLFAIARQVRRETGLNVEVF